MLRNLPIITDVLVALTPEKEIPDFVPFLHTLLGIHHKRFSAHELLINIFTSSKVTTLSYLVFFFFRSHCFGIFYSVLLLLFHSNC